jgi:hypothetical protein
MDSEISMILASMRDRRHSERCRFSGGAKNLACIHFALSCAMRFDPASLPLLPSYVCLPVRGPFCFAANQTLVNPPGPGLLLSYGDFYACH